MAEHSVDHAGPSGGQGIGDPDARATAVVVAVSAILLVAIVVLLQAFFYRAEQGEIAVKVVAVTPEELAGARAEQLERLHTYRWVDEKAGTVAIPIERAMALVVAEHGGTTRLPGDGR